MMFFDIGQEVFIFHVQSATLVQEVEHTSRVWLEKIDYFDVVCEL